MQTRKPPYSHANPSWAALLMERLGCPTNYSSDVLEVAAPTAKPKSQSERSKKAVELILLGRSEKEEARQKRNFRLGRDYSPMPGYPSFVSEAV